jgi:hypothetical protein
MIILEEDSFILKPISIIKGNEFGISVFEYNTNVIPEVLLDVVKQVGGNVNIPLNIFGNKGYGAGGGFIVDCQKWCSSWEKFRPILELNYETIASQHKLIGWFGTIGHYGRRIRSRSKPTNGSNLVSRKTRPISKLY